MAARARKRIRLSYVIRDDGEEAQDRLHRFGINACKLDAAGRRLFTAGRDSIVRSWGLTDAAGAQLETPTLMDYYRDHTDWVNDIAICEDWIVTASSDATVKVWQDGGGCIATLRQHEDYIKGIAWIPEQQYIVSAGLDSNVVFWDLRLLREQSNPSMTVAKMPESVYSIASNDTGTLVLTGSADKTIRTWDVRSKRRIASLKGHGDNIKALALSADGTKCLSGSSDCTLKMWDIGQQRCVATYNMHADSVWALEADSDFSRVFTGGRDGNVFSTNLKVSPDEDCSRLLFTETNPVLNLAVSPDAGNLWVATTDSTVRNWPIADDCKPNQMEASTDSDSYGYTALSAAPLRTIQGSTALNRVRLLPDRIHVLTRDTNNQVAKWNIVECRKVEEFGPVDFETQCEALVNARPKKNVSTWCSVDTKLGSITVHLDDSSAFSAWTFLSTLRGTRPVEGVADAKINIGGSIIRCLLKEYQQVYMAHAKYATHAAEPADLKPFLERARQDLVAMMVAHNLFELPVNLSVMLSQREDLVCLARFEMEEAGQFNSRAYMHLRDYLPTWITDCLFNKDEPFGAKSAIPRFIFNLHPNIDAAPDMRIPPLSPAHLTSPTFLQFFKVAKYIFDHCGIKEDYKEGTDPTSVVELLCRDEVLDYDSDLAAAKLHLWKSGEDLTITFRKKR